MFLSLAYLVILIGINKVQLLGRVGSDPKKLGSIPGKEIVAFNVATTYTLPSRQTEESYTEGKRERERDVK